MALAFAFYLPMSPCAFGLDQSMPSYRPVSTVSGELKAVGSDTMNVAAKALAKAFMAKQPGVKIQVEGEGSDTAPRALLEGTAQFGLMSRPMTAQEINTFEKKYGYRLGRFRAALDALVIFVNKENPVACLALQQLDRIFSTSRQGSGGGSIVTWGGVGLSGEWSARRISLYGRNAASGTYAYFRSQVLYGGDYMPTMQQLPTVDAVADAVAQDKLGIGYGGLGSRRSGIRTVPISTYEGGECFDASAESVFSDKYPFSRYLYIYTNKKPDEPLDALRAEFVRFVLSMEGQALIADAGFYPLGNPEREADLAALGLASAK